ncbi:MAG: MgtC/SapB family protein [Spirochaetales bacterium]|nr:MgtC/SapB family protein [Spirochaetales bacterium]
MEIEYLIRLIIAAICGALIGLEREKRQKSAGLRTHIIVAIASSLMMIVSKYGFFDVLVHEGVSVDVSRVAAGVVSAIGFIGGGVIFLKRDTLVGLTTAAGLWATVGVGIAIGAGMYVTGIFTTLFILLLQLIMHWKKLRVVSSVAGNITVNITKHDITLADLRERLEKKGLFLRNISLSRSKEDDFILKASIVFSKRESMDEIIEEMKHNEIFESIDLFTLN